MAYLLAWRMALAKHLLRQNENGVAAIAERIGYSSGSTFSVAFTRHVGQPTTHYAPDPYRPAGTGTEIGDRRR